jgi:hypothetical protein
MPAQKRLRRLHQSVAPVGREQARERRKQRAIRLTPLAEN